MEDPIIYGRTLRIMRQITDAMKASSQPYLGETMAKVQEEKTMSFKAKMPDGREVECPAPDTKEWEDTGEGYKKIPEKDQEIILITTGQEKHEKIIHTLNNEDIDKPSKTKGRVRHETGKCYLSDMDRHLSGRAKLTTYTIWRKK